MAPAEKKILVIKLGALGDAVIATSHIKVLLDYHQQDEVCLITSPSFTCLFEELGFREIYELPPGDALGLVKLMRLLFVKGFDIVYDLQTNDRSALLVLSARAERRIGLGHRFIYTDHEQSRDYQRHIHIRVKELFANLGLPEAEDRPVVPASSQTLEKVDSWQKQSGLESYVLMHAGSSPKWISKRWAPENFVELAELLVKDGLQVVWIGANDEAALNASLAKSTGIDATSLFSLHELVEVGRRAEFAVVSDSGPMHLLSASDIPVYAFFGPTDFKRSHAIGQQQNVLVSNAECSPCFLPVCPSEKQHKCLNDISVSDVYNRLKADKCI